jgi:antitoxin ParD1/3/4
MSISLTPRQERLVQTKLQGGKYHSAEELLETALHLLSEHDRANAHWVERVRDKVDTAIATSEHTAPIDGESFVNQMLERFRQGQSTQA